MLTESIGWLSTLILCATISRQVYTHWKTRSTAGVSHWLFIGQLAASASFVIASSWKIGYSFFQSLPLGDRALRPSVVHEESYAHRSRDDRLTCPGHPMQFFCRFCRNKAVVIGFSDAR